MNLFWWNNSSNKKVKRGLSTRSISLSIKVQVQIYLIHSIIWSPYIGKLNLIPNSEMSTKLEAIRDYNVWIKNSMYWKILQKIISHWSKFEYSSMAMIHIYVLVCIDFIIIKRIYTDEWTNTNAIVTFYVFRHFRCTYIV